MYLLKPIFEKMYSKRVVVFIYLLFAVHNQQTKGLKKNSAPNTLYWLRNRTTKI